MKRVILLTTGISLLGMGLVFAQDATQPRMSLVETPKPVDVGNKICPVSGNPIGVMGPGVQYEYNGKIYHLCCGGCIGRFASDPERYSKIADDEVKGQ